MSLFFLIAGAVFVGSQANRLFTAVVVATFEVRRARRARVRFDALREQRAMRDARACAQGCQCLDCQRLRAAAVN